jgi:predicted acylesterase/phospholipase RssA
MSISILANASEGASKEAGVSDYELYISAGGVTAVLSGVGFQLAASLAGVRKWKRIHGVSGGSIIAAVSACGHSAQTLLSLALNLQFGDYVCWRRGVLGAFFTNPLAMTRSVPQANNDWRECHWWGLLGTAGVGGCVSDYAEQLGLEGSWPAGFTTMATTRWGDPVVFHEGGAFIVKDGREIVIADKPVPLALAVRASCTIGGIMVPLRFKGHTLFDGGLSRDGFCPVGVPIRHLGSNPDKMIAVRVNEVHPTTFIGKVHRAVRYLWWVHPDYHWGPETAGVVEIYPPIQHVPTLKFGVSRDEKWLAILLAFQESLAVLALEGILHGDKLAEAREIMEELGYWRDFMPAKLGQVQRLSTKAEEVFSRHGLYESDPI